MPRILPILILIGITIFTLVTVVQSGKDEVRHLPKWLWLVLVLIVPVLGCAAWYIFGRPLTEGEEGHHPARPVAPDDDPEFLRGL
jgi:membrane protein DedA with SNARE-associated domain